MALPSTCIVLVAEDDPIVALDLARQLGSIWLRGTRPRRFFDGGSAADSPAATSIALLSASVAEGGFLLLGNVLASLMVPLRCRGDRLRSCTAAAQ